MALLVIRRSFRATHGSKVLYNDAFTIELAYRAPIEGGFVGGMDYNEPKRGLLELTQRLDGSYLNDIIGRATKEFLAEYILYELHHPLLESVRIHQDEQSFELSASEVELTSFEDQFVLNRARGFLFRRRFDEALVALDALGNRAEQFQEALHIRGRCQHYLELHQESKDTFLRLLELSPENAEAYRNIANCCLELGKNETMLEYFERAVALAPRDARILNNRGFAFQRVGELERALADHDQAIEVWPEYIEAYIDRAECHSRLGNRDLAEQDKENARRLSTARPGYSPFKEILL